MYNDDNTFTGTNRDSCVAQRSVWPCWYSQVVTTSVSYDIREVTIDSRRRILILKGMLTLTLTARRWAWGSRRGEETWQAKPNA